MSNELLEEREEVQKTIEHFESLAYGERGYNHALFLDRAKDRLQKIDEELADYDPTPYCSYGHKTKASCDCGPIAENE